MAELVLVSLEGLLLLDIHVACTLELAEAELPGDSARSVEPALGPDAPWVAMARLEATLFAAERGLVPLVGLLLLDIHGASALELAEVLV